MTATTVARATPRADGAQQGYPVKAATKILQGVMVCLDATGYLVMGATATTLIIVGKSTALVDNTAGANGDLSAIAEQGVFQFFNSTAGDLIALTEVGKDCYIVDNQTVAKTNGSSTRSRAGKVVNVDANGVWVQIAPQF